VAQLYRQALGSLFVASHDSHGYGGSIRTRVKVTLRLTVSQSASLGIEPHLGLMTRYLLFFDSYALSDVRTGPLFYILLVLASVVFLGSESLGTRDHILLYQI
jgi:hypothetical protein